MKTLNAESLMTRPLLMLADEVAPVLAQLDRAQQLSRRGPSLARLARFLPGHDEDQALEAAEVTGQPLVARSPSPAAEVVQDPAAKAPAWASSRSMNADRSDYYTVIDGVAHIHVDTPLYSEGFWAFGLCLYWGYDTISMVLAECAADPQIRGVFLSLDTPGGVVTGVSDAARAIAGFSAASGKPLHCWASMAASAGYWLASGADRLTADDFSIIGSIGVVMARTSYANWLKKEGVTVTPIHFGARKADLWPETVMSAEEQAELQAHVDDIGISFVDAVAEARDLAPQAVIALEARVFNPRANDPARSALALGLVDAINNEEAAFDALLAEIEGGQSVPSGPAAGKAASSGMEKETPMSLETNIEKLRTAANAGNADAQELLAQLARSASAGAAAATEEDEQSSGEGGENEEVMDEEEEQASTSAEGDEEEAAEEDEEEPSGEGDEDEAPDAATQLAIRDLPEAEGRAVAALELSKTPGMTITAAKAALSHIPKGGQLSGKMQNRQMPGASGGEESPAKTGAVAETRQLMRLAGRGDRLRKTG